jgi:hypothetical protein
VEGVFVLLVIGMDALADLVGGSARRDEWRLETRRPGLQRQHDFADVAGDDEVDLVLIDRTLERANRVGRGGVVVIGDDFDLAAIDTALGVDFVGGHLGGLRDRCPGNGLRLGDDADLDRVRGQRLTGRRRQQAKRGRAEKSRQGPGHGRSGCFCHIVSLHCN